jgi:hypothetical protein
MKHFDIHGEDHWHFQQGGKSQRGFDIVRTAAEWDALWEGQPPGPLPDGAMAVVVHMGARSEGPWSLEVCGVRDEGDRLVLDIEQCGPSGIAMRAPFAPYAVRLIEASDKDIAFNIVTPPDRGRDRHLRPGAGPRPAL